MSIQWSAGISGLYSNMKISKTLIASIIIEIVLKITIEYMFRIFIKSIQILLC